MFDAEEAARMILDQTDEKKPSGPSGREAFSAAWKAMQEGDEATAYDAFRAAVAAAGTEPDGDE